MRMPLLLSAGLVTLFCATAPVRAAEYIVDYDSSSVSFAGQHAGADFTGAFESWSAAIDFDPADLAGSSITATFDLASASTGSKLYDGTLPSKDWFNVREHPQGLFKSRALSRTEEGGRYHAEGTLSLRGNEEPVAFDFTLSDLSGSAPVTVRASFPLNRLVYGIGGESDPNAEWVSEEITITLDIQAARKSARE